MFSASQGNVVISYNFQLIHFCTVNESHINKSYVAKQFKLFFLVCASPSKYLTDLKHNTWEEWLMDKALLDIQKITVKKEEKKKLHLERMKKEEEKQRKIIFAKENREEWLKNKIFELQKKKKEEDAQIEFEKLKVFCYSIIFYDNKNDKVAPTKRN